MAKVVAYEAMLHALALKTRRVSDTDWTMISLLEPKKKSAAIAL